MENVIIDLDTGIDDSIALALAIADENINILGITTTYGNVQTKRSCINSRFILDLFNQQNIPVYKGLEHAILKNTFKRNKISSIIHGKNGLGNIDENFNSYNNEAFTFFVPFVLEQIKKYNGNITYITTGPLTNIAYLLENHNEEIIKINKVISMGGAIIFPGNVSNSSEANIHKDPHSAKIVFESTLKTVLVPLDVTQKVRINQNEILHWKNPNNRKSNIFYNMITHYMNNTPNLNQCCYVHDPSAIMYCINPSLFTTIEKDLTVLENKNDFGRVVGNIKKIEEEKASSIICLDVKAEKLKNYIITIVTNLLNK